MRIFQSIIIFSFLFFASNQCEAGVFDFAPLLVQNHPPCTEQTDLDDAYLPVNLIHFFQRTEQVLFFNPTGQEFPDELFLRFAESEKMSTDLIPSVHFCISIGLVLIFPKHYFY